MAKQEQSSDLIKHDRVLSRPIVLFSVLAAICVFGRESFLSGLGISDQIYNIIRYGGCLAFLLLAIKRFDNRSFLWMLFLEVLFGISYLFSYFQGYMTSETLLVYCVTTLLICIPCSACISCVADKQTLYNELKYSSFIISLIVLIYMYWPYHTSEYFMGASYELVFTGSLHINEIFRNKKKKLFYVLLSAFEVVTIFIKGARGPLFCILIFLIIKILIVMRHNPRMLFLGFLGAIALLIAFLNLSSIIGFISGFLEKLGLHSRTLGLILENQLLDDSGRGGIKKEALNLIWERPFIGYGAASDVKLIGGYPHSLPIELMFDYGIFLGGGFFIAITICVIRTVFEKESIEKDLKLIFLTQGYVMLFLSGTYLQSFFLFLFLGLVISVKKNDGQIEDIGR